MCRCYIILILLTLTLSFNLFPLAICSEAADSAPSYSLEKLEALTLKIHPAIGATAAGVEIERGELESQKAYPNPEADISLGQGKSLEGNEDKFEYGFGFSQVFPWLGERRWRKETAKWGIEAALKEFENQELEAITQVKKMYFSILAQQRKVEIARENFLSAERLLELITRRVELGEGREIERIKAQVEYYRLERAFKKAKTVLKSQMSALNRFLGNALGVDFILIGEIGIPEGLISIERWQESALTAHPLIQGTKFRTAQAKSRRKAEEQVWIPDARFRGFYQAELDREAYGAGVGLQIPLWNWNRGKISKARAAERKTQFELELLKQEIQVRLISQYAQYQVAYEQARSFEEYILKEARKSVELAEFSYRQGEIDLLNLLDSRRVYWDTENEYISALLDFWLARTELERIAGGGVEG